MTRRTTNTTLASFRGRIREPLQTFKAGTYLSTCHPERDRPVCFLLDAEA